MNFENEINEEYEVESEKYESNTDLSELFGYDVTSFRNNEYDYSGYDDGGYY